MGEALGLVPGSLDRQPGLADTAGAEDGEQAAGGIGEVGGDLGQLRLAADEGGGAGRQVVSGSGGRGERENGRGLAGRAAADGLEQGGRFRLRFDAQLLLQDLDAFLILADGCGAVTGPGMKLHQQAMGRLVQRIERQPATSVRDGCLRIAWRPANPCASFSSAAASSSRRLSVWKVCQASNSTASSSVKPARKSARVNPDRFGEGRQAVVAEPAEGIVVVGNLRQQVVETRDVHLERRGLACHLIPFDRQRSFADGLAEVGEGAAQRGAPVLAVELRPEQRH